MRCAIVDFLVEHIFLQIPHLQAFEYFSKISVPIVTVFGPEYRYCSELFCESAVIVSSW